MKLAFVCGSLSWGGLEKNHLDAAVRMRDQGIDVVVLCRPDSIIASKAKEQRLAIIALPPHRRYKYLRASFQLATLLREHTVSHLFVRRSNDLNICSIAKRLLGGKIKLFYFMEMQLGVSKRNFLHTARFSQIDVWVCPLPYLKQQVLGLTRFPESRIRIIPSALNTKMYNSSLSRSDARRLLQLPEDVFLVGLPGRIDPLKGQDLLLKAMHLIPDKTIHVAFMGNPTHGEGGDYVQLLHQLIADYQLEDRVHFFRHTEDMAAFYRAIDVCVMASHSETFGMVTIEALAAGTPVIGSNAGGTPELLDHGKLGLLFESKSIEELVKQIKHVMQYPDQFTPAALQKSVERFDYRVIDEEIVQLLKLY